MMSEHTIQTLTSELALLPQHVLDALTRRQDWIETARPDQLPPDHDDFLYWMLMAGRGSGKTRAGVEDTWWKAFLNPERIAVVAPTNDDVRKTCFEGESGLIARIPQSLVINYNRTNRELWTRTLTGETSYYVGYSAEEAERLRGPQHHRAWMDEVGAYGPKGEDTLDNLIFGLRLGSHPHIAVTTTPRTTPLVRKLVADPSTIMAYASTFANKDNLPPSILAEYVKKYEGTRLGRQELYAELLTDVVGALWTDDMFIHLEDPTVSREQLLATLPLKRIVVAVDPSGASGKNSKSDEIGIIVAGELDTAKEEFIILQDATMKGSPAEWGATAVGVYHEWGADRLVAESNFGGAMVEAVIRNADSNVAFKEVRASRGKVARAEPVSALYEQHRVFHVRGLEELEKQMCLMTNDGYQGTGSPDRVDAAVWAISFLSGRTRRDDTDLAIDGARQHNSAKIGDI